jgi:hypothetical protein
VPGPPPTRRDDFHEQLHGVGIVDPHRWLEDQSAPETRAWIDAQTSTATVSSTRSRAEAPSPRA